MKVDNGKAPDIRQRTFSFTKKEWPDEDNFQKMKIEDSNGGAEYSERLRILSGREHPELFLFWLENMPIAFGSTDPRNAIRRHVKKQKPT